MIYEFNIETLRDHIFLINDEFIAKARDKIQKMNFGDADILLEKAMKEILILNDHLNLLKTMVSE